MADGKTLIAYESKLGATRDAAKHLAEALRKSGFEIDVVDLKKDQAPSLAMYQNVVVGAGVRGGRVYSTALKFLSGLSGKKVAFYTCSSWGGTPGSYENAKKQFVEKTLQKHPNIAFVASEAFGGKIRYFKKTMLDNTDPTKVEAWAKVLAEKFSQ